MKRSLFFALSILTALTLPGQLFAQDDTAAKIAAATAAASASKGASVTLWRLFESGGPAMIALAIMSVLTVMLIVAYTITVRRGAVLSNQFMNTAEVLLQKRD